MLKNWENATVTKIVGAMQVPVGYGKAIHKDRVAHGFVLNEVSAVKDYVFSDGRVMRTEGCALFYLPKGSSYHVESLVHDSCYAINFDADLSGEPFAILPRNTEPLFKLFREVAAAWKRQDPARQVLARRAVYDIILFLSKEWKREYVPKEKEALLSPALEILHERFTENGLSVASLAKTCGVSEVYFRKIFTEKYGCSPKEYMIFLRMQYAKELLSSGGMTVNEAAALCGYAEPCHFSREFSRHVGKSPTAYKNDPNEA